MIRKHIFLVLMVVLLLAEAQAQDALFSQLQNSRNLLNPSLLAVQNGPLQIDLNFREQGGAVTSLPIRTFQVLANFAHQSFKVDQMSYGLSVFNDAGGQGHIGSAMAHLHFAYLKKLTGAYSKIGEHYLGFGTSLGGGQRSVGGDKFWFGNQFNQEYNFIEEGADPRENVLLARATARTKLIPDISLGLSWYANINEGFSGNAGFSMFHLEQANISLIEGGSERQKIRFVAHAGIRKSLSDIVAVLPKIQYIKHGNSNQVVFGSEVAMDNRDDSEIAVRLGIFGRAVTNTSSFGMESLLISLNTEYNEFMFGFGYDLTISSLAKYNNGRGAWEFNVGYAMDRSKKTGYNRKADKFSL